MKNREIKFRAWDIDRKKMRDMKWLVNNFVESEGQSCLDIILFHNFVFEREWIDGELFEPLNSQHFVPMQYTGLKDKNGKEIYEGDIMQGGVCYEWSYEKGLGIIRFGEYLQDGSGGEYAPTKVLGFYVDIIKSKHNDLGETEINQDKASKLEVVGNIYENPELLK